MIYSKNPDLSAWLFVPKGTGATSFNAIIFLHGGFAMSAEDWEMTKPYRDADYIVMMPALRGENGQTGDFSMFYDEVKDVLAAHDYLSKVPGVSQGLSQKKIYLAGHSVGGTLALITAMTTDRFRAVASFSAAPDVETWAKSQPEIIPFDPANQKEFDMRSPINFPNSFQSPVTMYYGDTEKWTSVPSEQLAARAKELGGKEMHAVSVPGDHFSAVEPAMQQSLKFFQMR